MNSRDLNRDDWDLPWDNDNGTVAPPKKKQLDYSGFAFLLGLLDWRLEIWLGNVMGIKQTMAMNIRTISFSILEDWIVRPFGDTSRKQHTHSSDGLSVRSWSNLSRSVIFDLLHAKGIGFCSIFVCFARYIQSESFRKAFSRWQLPPGSTSFAMVVANPCRQILSKLKKTRKSVLELAAKRLACSCKSLFSPQASTCGQHAPQSVACRRNSAVGSQLAYINTQSTLALCWWSPLRIFWCNSLGTVTTRLGPCLFHSFTAKSTWFPLVTKLPRSRLLRVLGVSIAVRCTTAANVVSPKVLANNVLHKFVVDS